MSTYTTISKPSDTCISRMKYDGKLLAQGNLDNAHAFPDESNILIWYVMFKGPVGTPYDGGYYLGKIIHNPEYPFKAPKFMMLTPSGRFIPDNYICLSISDYHQEQWSPAWNIETILKGWLSAMSGDNPADSGLSHMMNTSKQYFSSVQAAEAERKRLAKNSIKWNQEKYPQLVKNFSAFMKRTGYIENAPEPVEPPKQVPSKKNEDYENIDDYERAILESLKDIPDQNKDGDDDLARILQASLKDIPVQNKNDDDAELARILQASLNDF